MIKAAAIKTPENIWTLPPPARHHNIIWLMLGWEQDSPPPEDFKGKIIPAHGEQGFIDDTGFFLDRRQAAIHAKNVGQLMKPLIAPPNLFSEDLW